MTEKKPKKLNDLPKSDDIEFWEGETYISKPVRIEICKTHGKNWQDHIGYIDNHDGTASCKYCSWGFRIPGYMRIHEGKICDLRDM